MVLLAAPLASILMMTVLVIALRLTGDAGFLRSWRLWLFTLGFIGWGPVLYMVLHQWLGSSEVGPFVTTYVFLLTVSALVTLMLTIVLETFNVAALAAGTAFLLCALAMNVAALFAKHEIPAHLCPTTGFWAALAWNTGLAGVMIPAALRERTINVRSANRQCLNCGYDLNTVLRSHRCPECGEAFREPREGDLPLGEA